MHRLPFRQIHLDFHTSEKIPGIGAEFDKKVFQQTLLDAEVNSVTCFGVCHHGLAYYQTKLGNRHPDLKVDLLEEQYAACKEVDINVPIYITAGVNDWVVERHPEWRAVGVDGRFLGWTSSLEEAGFKSLCFNTPHLDLVCDQIREVAQLFPENDGIFLDIIHQYPCACKYCRESMKEKGMDFTKEEERAEHAKDVLQKYYERSTAALREVSATIPIFHNSGNVQRGQTDILKYFSHLELESLPTGGWGYDHFPMSAKYVNNLEHDVMGMTGKFHTTWGEFGGFKHPNALRYECASMLANGTKCSIGDQLHPSGKIDASTYEIIGRAYREVKAKEAWCDDVTQQVDVSILSSSAMSLGKGGSAPDEGASRLLLEGHIPFDLIDRDMDFSRAKLLILPDDIEVDEKLKDKLDAYMSAGGKLLLTGKSGIGENGEPLFDIGGNLEGESPYNPDYALPIESLRPDYLSSPCVMYTRAQRLKVTDGESLGEVYDPYFNREHDHFSSHQHTPFKPESSGYQLGSIKGKVMYLAHPVFTLYRGFGNVVFKDILLKAIRHFLGEESSLETNLPSTARISLMEQAQHNRHVLHLLYANTVARGGAMDVSGGNLARKGATIEVIEELMPLRDIEVSLKLDKAVKKVTLEPQGLEIPFNEKDGRVFFKVNEFTNHQMVVLST